MGFFCELVARELKGGEREDDHRISSGQKSGASWAWTCPDVNSCSLVGSFCSQGKNKKQNTKPHTYTNKPLSLGKLIFCNLIAQETCLAHVDKPHLKEALVLYPRSCILKNSLEMQILRD